MMNKTQQENPLKLFSLIIMGTCIVLSLLFSGVSGQFFTTAKEKIRFSAIPEFMEKNQPLNNAEKETADLQNSSWYSSVIKSLRSDEYNINFNPEYMAYQSPNRSQNLRFVYYNDGFTAKPRQLKIPLYDINDRSVTEEEKEYREIADWKIRFKLSGYGRKNDMKTFAGNEFSVIKNTAKIEDKDFAITYHNSEEGMRQDFIVKHESPGEGLLRVAITLETDLRLRVGADALAFTDSQGEEKMKYSRLKVFDNNGNILPAHFEKKNENEFVIAVNDMNAEYPITIDPLSTTANWTAEINQDYAYFGASVSTAGDVNGDGYSDVIVGASRYDNGESNEGCAFVFHGSASGLSATANWTAESNQADAYLGQSVYTAGDVNGDGFSDVIVGANYFDNGQTNEGRAFVYHGSASGLSATANWTAESNQVSAYLGQSVSTAGDVNGDGYSDVIVGANYFDNGQTDEGRAFVYHGSASGLSATANWTAESNQAYAYLGQSVSTAADVNGDGYSDVIVGANYFDNPESNEGRAFVYYGSASGLSATANWTAESNQVSAYFGTSVCTAGDVNGDGYSDVIVGANYFDNVESNEGRAFVYYGSASGLSATANWTAESNQNQALFGYSVSTAGDINGDGYSDVIVGAYFYDNGETDEGGSFVYQGSANGLSATANWSAESNQASAFLGYSVSTAGDVNGDGYSDVIVGGHYYDNAQTDEGRAYVYHGSASGLATTSNWTAESNQINAYLGISVSTAGDVNGDGYSDVIVGANGYDGGEYDEGRVFVYHGSASGLSASANWTAEGDQDYARFGSSVSTAGDVNGDGYGDVIVGAFGYDNGETDEGRAFVYHGSASGLSTTANWTAESNQAIAYFGGSVSTAGDVNGDGYSDVIVGANGYGNGEYAEGVVFVYHGSTSGLSTGANWTAESNLGGAYFGISVSNAGDVNGDGYSDVIVGATFADYGDAGEGAAFVYHGSASGLSTNANWRGESNQENAQFGVSVSTAGDVNGDGYSDVIVGAHAFDDFQLDEGIAFVYLGSSSGLLLTSSWNSQSNQTYANFGYSVSTAGDVNGDGYSDVIIGAHMYDNGQTDEGRAFVYYGSKTGLSNTVNWTSESNQASAYFGYSVSSAGDVNGDGYSDVIVGAYLYDNSYTNQGGAFVYYGNEGTSLRKTVQQYQPSSSTILGPNGLTGAVGQVRLNSFGKSPFGRADGKLVWEYKRTGQPFGNNASSSGEGSFTDLGTTLTGIEITNDVSGITTGYNYRWRARVKYSPVNNPFQVYSPWRYYEVYQPESFGSFKAQNTPLPVELIAFTGYVTESGVKLNWQTATEVNNYGFEIHRSLQGSGEDWENIGFVIGNGNSNSEKSYSFTDGAIVSGIKYLYRLKQIDTDGKFEYSQQVAVFTGKPENFSLEQNYPNPFNPATTIEFSIPAASVVLIEVYDMLGNKVTELLNDKREAGYYSVPFNASALPSGVYVYRIEAGEYRAVKKMTLIK
ncbi:MAG: FG-GAP-like repeat-containing protein [Ignavibacteriaceae bacterium]|nr:FG-GAP-like repeat-containing protein [Ignavibacteriaceae bacterium]